MASFDIGEYEIDLDKMSKTSGVFDGLEGAANMFPIVRSSFKDPIKDILNWHNVSRKPKKPMPHICDVTIKVQVEMQRVKKMAEKLATGNNDVADRFKKR